MPTYSFFWPYNADVNFVTRCVGASLTYNPFGGYVKGYNLHWKRFRRTFPD